MLTKDHLKVRFRAGRIKPVFINTDDQELLDFAAWLIGSATKAIGLTTSELASKFASKASTPAELGLIKLVQDRLQFAGEDEAISEFRWQCLTKSEAFRNQGACETLEEFQKAMATAMDEPVGILSDRLYGDLPSLRQIIGFKELTAAELLQRYNTGLVQGLLLKAEKLTIDAPAASLSEKRVLFRALKFHRLIAEVDHSKSGSGFSFALSGPLGIFEQGQLYGMRLANFFPHLLHLSQWKVTADVVFKKHPAVLSLDQKSGLVSHYRRQSSYVPDEYATFLKNFTKASEGRWSLQAGDEFIHLGSESYCFPDFVAINKEGTRVAVELFHKWHQHQLEKRLENLSRDSTTPLILGIARQLSRSLETSKCNPESPGLADRYFTFVDFPTAKTLLKVLTKTYQG